MTRAWCSDPARDEAVRAAEDGRQGPLPTLGEAIAAFCADDPAKRSPKVSETGNGQSGLRTERVTLEVTHNEFFPVREWSWITMLRLRPGESVRVVEEFGSALPKVVESMADEIKRLESDRDAARVEAEHDVREVLAMARLERDAAIRERDAHKARVDYLERDRKVWALQSGSFEKEANALRARVAELEETLATAQEWNRRHVPISAPAGSGAANSLESPVSSEPVAWGVRNADDEWVCILSSRPLDTAGYTVVPLYTASPPARGWLTEQEREALKRAFDLLCDDDGDNPLAGTVQRLLARSSPPEVVLPKCEFTRLSTHMMGFLEAIGRVKQALAAAGVAVKEVG